jgi:O-antigen/teichoic acid export membrane protein
MSKRETVAKQRDSQDMRHDKMKSRVLLQPFSDEKIEAIDQKLPSPYLFNDPVALYDQPTLVIPTVQNVSSAAQSETHAAGESYGVTIRKLFKSSGAYALSSMASPLVSLILAPFLTHNLSHTDFGALAVLNTAIGLVAGITQLGLGSAFFRSYNYDYESRIDRLGVLSTVLILLSLISVPTAVVIIIAAPWVAQQVLGTASYSNAVRLAGVVVLLQNFTIPGFAWLRAENRTFFFLLLSIANLFTTLVGTLILLGILHMGITGSIIAIGMGYAVAAACLLPIILLRAGVRFRLDIAKGLLSFGIPNVTNFVSVWVLQLSDRYLLSHLGSLSQTASYAVAYSLGGVLSAAVIAPFSLAWPSAMYAIAKKNNADQVFQLVFRWFSLTLLWAAFGLSLISIAILNLLFPPSYHAAAPIIPIITASIVFYGTYNMFTIGISIKRKTWFAVAFTATSAIVNVLLNLILIPIYGSMGAAWSTLIAYAVLALVAYLVNHLIFDIGRFSVAFLLGIALYIGVTFQAQQQDMYMRYLIYIGIALLYGGSLVFIGKIPAKMPKHKNSSIHT